ncbi:14912_t:CDS:2 [Racocetra fulgida]|uniref:14912_t:CDS:1 n=1 Tax=Racocetra fulgida TaxID=60492 RepID=A0A9N8ZNK1_9GLOM|nr:14912_t:CDS:2 [Racocetra fulgida]
MPHLGYHYEIEDYQDYTWQITNWASLEKRTTGPEFEAGEVVSIYLDFADKDEAPTDWHCCAQFALALWNPEDPTFCVVHCTC